MGHAWHLFLIIYINTKVFLFYTYCNSENIFLPSRFNTHASIKHWTGNIYSVISSPGQKLRFDPKEIPQGDHDTLVITGHIFIQTYEWWGWEIICNKYSLHLRDKGNTYDKLNNHARKYE